MDVLATLLRVVLVFGLLALVLWVLKRTDRARGGRRGAPVQVVGSTRLSKGASLTVVRIGDEEVVLGVTDSSVSVLGSGPAPAPAAVEEAPALPAGERPDFAAALSASLARTLGPAGARLVTGAVGLAPARSDVSAAAVAAALASVRGEPSPAAPPAAAPSAAAPSAAAPSAAAPSAAAPSAAAPSPASGPAGSRPSPAGPLLPDPATRAALHRAVTRTRARTAPAV